MNANRCEACAQALPDDDDCTADGVCAKLRDAGAINVTVGVMRGPWGSGKVLFVRGGWLCRGCAARWSVRCPR